MSDAVGMAVAPRLVCLRRKDRRRRWCSDRQLGSWLKPTSQGLGRPHRIPTVMSMRITQPTRMGGSAPASVGAK
jgi:hypothetical protein